MSITLHVLEVVQPIGTFYIGKIASDKLVKIAKSCPRSRGMGVQRELKTPRAKDISKYCSDPDATFPTPIILSIESNKLESDITSISDAASVFKLIFKDHSEPFADILDGQHRLEGIKNSDSFLWDIPIVIMFDLTEEEKAYIFSTINSNQEKVDKSLIYELFELSTFRSPYKTCHEIARIMNSDKESPFFEKLKMLGKAQRKSETLSQGTFVNYLCKLMSKNPKNDYIDLKNGKKLKEIQSCVLRDYFIHEQDEVILKIITNYFKAVSIVFEKEWNDQKSILSKTTGYGGLLKAFPKIYKVGIAKKTLSLFFFSEVFAHVKDRFVVSGIDLTTKTINLGDKGQNELASKIKDVIDDYYPLN